MNAIDSAIAEAARLAAPVFAAEGWVYGSLESDGVALHVPDIGEMAKVIGSLIDRVSAVDLKIPPGSDGATTTAASGRFVVSRHIEPGFDDISIALELAEVERDA